VVVLSLGARALTNSFTSRGYAVVNWGSTPFERAALGEGHFWKCLAGWFRNDLAWGLVVDFDACCHSFVGPASRHSFTDRSGALLRLVGTLGLPTCEFASACAKSWSGRDRGTYCTRDSHSLVCDLCSLGATARRRTRFVFVHAGAPRFGGLCSASQGRCDFTGLRHVAGGRGSTTPGAGCLPQDAASIVADSLGTSLQLAAVANLTRLHRQHIS